MTALLDDYVTVANAVVLDLCLALLSSLSSSTFSSGDMPLTLAPFVHVRWQYLHWPAIAQPDLIR